MHAYAQEELDVKGFAAQCLHDVSGGCAYRQSQIENRPEGTDLGRKFCQYDCKVTYRLSDDTWTDYVDVSIFAASDPGYGNTYSWNNGQKAYGIRIVRDPRFPDFNVGTVRASPFTVNSILPNKYPGLHQPLIDAFDEAFNSE